MDEKEFEYSFYDRNLFYLHPEDFYAIIKLYKTEFLNGNPIVTLSEVISSGIECSIGINKLSSGSTTAVFSVALPVISSRCPNAFACPAFNEAPTMWICF
jgi:hypothetical protein